jgi:4-amino-4-deoxy-L-arabinose transferase-like glycosyltransferase
VPDRSSELRLPSWAVFLLWVLALPLMLLGLGTPVVQRTQEARVLETAREMVASGDARQWLIPQLNGEVRLRKPPLAYWVAAGSFKLLGVGEFAGRLPFALAGWLTLAVVYRFGRGLVDPAFGLFAAAMLLGSHMFVRHFRLAETDALAALFVTAAVQALWRGARADRGAAWVLWFQWAGLAIGLAVLAKGLPGLFPVLFFVAWLLYERRWTSATRFLLSGAVLTGLVVGCGWYAYLLRSPGAGQVWQELARVTEGENHPAPFYVYVPQMLAAVAPWTGFFVLGLVWAVAGASSRPAARVVLLWGAAVFVPLCLIGNKQVHYLVPVVPVLAMLGAYAIHRGMGVNADDRRVVGWVFAGTVAVSLASPVAVIWAARHARGVVQNLDVAVVVLALAGAVGAVSVARRHGVFAGLLAYAAGAAMAMAVIVGRWLPSLDPVNHRTIAAELRRQFGDGPYVSYGRNQSLPLVWNLRTIVPKAETADELARVVQGRPDTVVIAQTKNKVEPPPLPALPGLSGGWTEVGRLPDNDGMVFRVYRVGP